MSVAVRRAGRAFELRRRVAPRLLSCERPTFAELGIYAVVLAVATGLLLGEHVRASGWYSDDWAYRSLWLQFDSLGFWGQMDALMSSDLLAGRPTLAVYLSLVQQMLGPRQGAHLAWAAVLAVVFSGCVYLLLRNLRFRPLDAGLVGLLLLVFPGSDSTRIWAMISDAQVAMSLVLLGVVCGLAALSASGRRAVALRVSASVLMFLGLTIYELTFGALLLTFLLYRSRVPWKRALRAGAIDWLTVALTWLLVLRNSNAERLKPAAAIDHGWVVLKQIFELFATVALPFDSVGAGIVIALVVVGLAVVVVRKLPAGDPTRAALIGWLWTAAVSVAFLAGAYVIYAPSSPMYVPLAPGLLNRTNAFGALPLIVLVYSLGALVAVLVFRGLSHERGWAAAATAAIALAIGIDYTAGITHHLRLWDSGWARAHAALERYKVSAPAPTRYGLVVMYGVPMQEADGIPVWAHNWDFEGALALTYHDATIRGRPAFPGTFIECRAGDAKLLNTLYSGVVLPHDDAAYGSLILFDGNTGRYARPRNRKECREQAPTFIPGPLVAPDPGAWRPG